MEEGNAGTAASTTYTSSRREPGRTREDDGNPGWATAVETDGHPIGCGQDVTLRYTAGARAHSSANSKRERAEEQWPPRRQELWPPEVPAPGSGGKTA